MGSAALGAPGSHILFVPVFTPECPASGLVSHALLGQGPKGMSNTGLLFLIVGTYRMSGPFFCVVLRR